MCPPPLLRRRATRNQTVKKLAAPASSPALRLSSAPAALTSDCLALFSAPFVSAGGTSYSGLRHRQQLFANFFARCHFVEHRFGRPPHLRGGVDSGFAFSVNSLFEKSLPLAADAVCDEVEIYPVGTGVLPLKSATSCECECECLHRVLFFLKVVRTCCSVERDFPRAAAHFRLCAGKLTPLCAGFPP